jgi:acetyl-CoA acetyltransferase
VAGTSGIQQVAVAGVGNTPFGALYRQRNPERTSYELAADAFADALADAGLDKSEVDGLLCVRVPHYGRMADMLGLPELRLVNVIEGAGRMAASAIHQAAMAIATGAAEVVAVVYGNNGRSAGATYGGAEAGPESTVAYDAMYGMTSPGAAVAHMYRRYQGLYGAPDDALAPVAINNRRNGARNPNAVFQSEISHEEYLASRYITEPLRLLDYCIINDGGVALILTSVSRARSLRKPPVVIGAIQSSSNLRNFYTVTDLFQSAARTVARRLFAEAGIKAADVDVAQIYDNFTPTVLFSLEGFGFCPPGTAWQWVQGDRINIGGELPINTSGGHTAESYMQGFGLLAEAVRQVRGECGERQVEGAEVSLYCCVAPITNAVLFHG